ncbi:TadE family type IV pilus minor pilin [Cellulomonas fengjieae]|uniref:Pilus assembly protein n=1 Tax=Cellulomonas fengjieae TaxID=2819978 RepID=A0ABS3SDN7_9CELL|nr:TadE family type IV pilus minor pilin [Cellulomonas fengjieae]MBO3083419.1 pilus assembly protein [Cellulomonas fengjieae]QVI65246.1 pilus assembly protein [Cellulomonas fengjieae]
MTAAGRRDRGSVTAELAVGLPVVVVLLTALLTIASTAVTQTRCTDAARAAARAAALGEPDPAVLATARRLAGDAASVAVTRADAWVTVEVSARVGSVTWGPLRAAATAVARVEP